MEQQEAEQPPALGIDQPQLPGLRKLDLSRLERLERIAPLDCPLLESL